MMLFHQKYNFRKYKLLEVKNELKASNWFLYHRVLCHSLLSCSVWESVDFVSIVLGLGLDVFDAHE